MVIYKTTNNINGKIYIGQDTKNDDKYYGSGNLIKYAIKKYGIDNFTKTILHECKSQSELNEMECFYILKYNTTDRSIGYNISYGGTNGTMLNRKHTDKTKEKMSISMSGKKKSSEHKIKLSDSHTGKKLSDETKEKISATQKLIKRDKLSDETKEKMSLAHKGKKLSDETKQKMSNAHSGVNNHFFGKTHSKETLLKTRKPIIQLDKDNNFIKEWCGVNNAAKELGIKQSGISLVLNGKYKTTGGFKFIYKNEK